MPVPIQRSAIEPFSKFELLAKQAVEGFITGLHKSPFHGFSVEFAEHRLYNKGESTRHIDWKLFGRTDKMFVKRYEEETNLRCQIVVDTSASMHYPEDVKSGQLNKVQFAMHAAAALTYLLRRQRDAVGLSLFDQTIHLHTAAKSSATHHNYLFTQMEHYMNQIGERSTFAVDALHEIADSIHKRSLVVLFTDALDTNDEAGDQLMLALQHLKHNKHEVILFHVLDKKHEMDFEFDNRPYTFVDTETGQEIKANPYDIKASYQEAMNQFSKALELKCGQYKIDYIQADIADGFDKVLLNYLIKRSKMY